VSEGSTVQRFLALRDRDAIMRVDTARREAELALPELVRLLVRRGAREVWLFGSLAWGHAGQGSDIDLAVDGLAPEEHLRAQGELLLAAPCSVDLVRLADAPALLAVRIRAKGRRLHG